MNRKRMMDGQATAKAIDNVRPFGLATQEPSNKPGWWVRLFVWLGILMADTNTPKGWTFNPATVTLALLVAGLIAGGAYYVGEKNADYRHLLERVAEAEKKAAAADTKATYAVKDADVRSGHAEPAPKKNK